MSGGSYSGIPATARAIMNLVPERKVPLTDKQQAQGESIQRAVDRLSQRDDAFMPVASNYQP